MEVYQNRSDTTKAKSQSTGVIAAGLALFSMFFGAGDLIWPLILGGSSGDKNFFSMLGLLITGVSLPLLGLMAMMLFGGNYRAFFGQIGRIPGAILIFLIQIILGPLGSVPRLFTLAHATIKPYLPVGVTLAIFSVFCCLLVFAFTIKRHKIVDIIGLLLCPVLLVALGAILVMGFLDPPAVIPTTFTQKEAFFQGLNVGYNTLDLIASFIFAPLVLSHFIKNDAKESSSLGNRQVFKKMIQACAISGGLLAAMYIGLTYLASFYTPLLPPHAPEERLATISGYLLGGPGALFSCVAVSLACLTTAIPISIITAEYIHTDFMKGKGNIHVPVLISLGVSMGVANLGFMGIAQMLSPILHMLCPGLIILAILSILCKLYAMPMRRVPVFTAFALSLVGYVTTYMV